MLARNVHDDIIGGVAELRPIGLRAELLGVVADRGDVGAEAGLRACSSSTSSQASRKALSEHLASMTSLRPPGRLTTTSGRSRPSSPSTETSVWKSTHSAQPGLLEHVLEHCSPQRPRALGDERSALTRLRVSSRTWPCPARTSSTCLAKAGIAVDPLLLDPLQPFLVALERRFDRLQQRLQLRLALLVGLGKALAGLFEEILVRLFQQLVADRRGTARPARPCDSARSFIRCSKLRASACSVASSRDAASQLARALVALLDDRRRAAAASVSTVCLAAAPSRLA